MKVISKTTKIEFKDPKGNLITMTKDEFIHLTNMTEFEATLLTSGRYDFILGWSINQILDN